MYGNDINPSRYSMIVKGVKAERQHVKTTHNPSSIEPGQKMTVIFPKLGPDDVIVPGSFVITGKLEVTSSKDKARTVVPNVGRKLVKTLTIKYEGNDVLTVNSYDELFTYFDQWLSKGQKKLKIKQGIQSENGLKLRVGANADKANTEEKAINTTLGSRFTIPIDFELLNDIGPYHQHSLADKLQIELTFNDVAAIVLASTSTLAESADRDYSYKFTDIRTEWDQISHSMMASAISTSYRKLALPYKRYHRHKTMVINKTDTSVNIQVNVPSKSLSHVFILPIDTAKDRKPYQHKEEWKNLDITNVKINLEGRPNALYSNGLLTEDTWTEIKKLFPGPSADVTMGEFLTKTYALSLDLRPSTDEKIHGNGTRLENTSEGLTFTIERTAASSGTEKLTLLVFVLQHAQLNILDWRYHSREF